jgi:hypothetical protein
MRGNPKNLKRNPVSLQPQLLPFLQRKRMQHLLNESRFLIGITRMARTKLQQQSTSISSVLTFKSSSCLCHLGSNMKLNGTNQADKKCDQNAKQVQQTEHPEVPEMMDLWILKAMNDKLLLTEEVPHQKWNTFTNLVGIPEDERLKLSNGWLTCFKDRNGLKEMKRHGEAASSSAETVENERKQIQELIKTYEYKLRDIFNMDEMGLFYGCAPIFSLVFVTDTNT